MSAGEKMHRIEYQLTEDDLVQFYIYYSSISDYLKKQRMKQRVRIPVLYLVVALLFFFSRRYEGSLLFLALAIGWFFLFPVWACRLRRKSFEKQIKEMVGDALSKPDVLELQEDGIFSSSYLGETKYAYTVVYRIVEHNGYTYIFIGKGMALVLPHDRIPAEDRRSFVDEVNRRREQVAQTN